MLFIRFDSFRLESARRVPTGQPGQYWLEVDGTIAAPGVMIYREDGQEVREAVTPEALDGDWLEQLQGAAVTLEHPPELLTPETDARYRVGTVKRTWRTPSGEAKATMRLTRRDAIGAVEAGQKRYLSPGYKAGLAFEPGRQNGQAYDRRQTYRRYGNHLALTSSPRGGEVCRMDSEDRMPDNMPIVDPNAAPMGAPPAEPTLKDLNDKMDAMMGRFDACMSRLDAMAPPAEQAMSPMDMSGGGAMPPKEDSADADEDDKDGEERMDSAALATVFAVAQKLGVTDLKGKSVKDVRNACLTRMDSSLSVGTKSEAYLAARFDAEAPRILAGKSLQEAINTAVFAGGEPETSGQGGQAPQGFGARLVNLGKK